jgi:YHS domain-containing protein
MDRPARRPDQEHIRSRKILFLGAALLGLLLYSGCNDSPGDAPPHALAAPAAAVPTAEHAHKPGDHGGLIVEIGADNYHAEIVVEKGGVVRLFTLGKDEARVQEVEQQEITAHATPEAGGDAVEVVFRPAPQKGDGAGKTSQFVGQLPPEWGGKPAAVTVPIAIAGERFRFRFTTAREEQHAEMPAKVSSDEERALYLTPGGLYTAADIEANGNTTAAEKFKGLKPVHDTHPQPGDVLCPVSLTKANAKFTWTVGGRAYEFCCPPCVDEFLKKAKEHPEQVLPPTEYVKH